MDDRKEHNGRSRRTARVSVVVGSLPARIPLRADRGAGVPGALRSFGAGIPVGELPEVVVSARTITWQTKV